MKIIILLAIISEIFTMTASANEFITAEPDGKSYQYVSNYSVEIDASKETVWKQLVNLGSWMYQFEMSHHSGETGKVGEVLQLYPNQNFFVQITGMVENHVLTIANLPSTFSGEYSTGVGVITLSGSGNKTVVNLTMSRRYTWQGESENPMIKKRAALEFQRNSGETWKNFLEKLEKLSEST